MRGLSIWLRPARRAAAPPAKFRTWRSIWTTKSGSLPGRNLDVYAADLERIEVLEGPAGHAVRLRCRGRRAALHHQQTQAGRHRRRAVNAGYSYTAHGDPNSNVDAMINLPLIPGAPWRCARWSTTTAVAVTSTTCRVTFTRLGYRSRDCRITNADGTYSPGVVPTNSAVINNNSTVGDAHQHRSPTKELPALGVGQDQRKDWNVIAGPELPADGCPGRVLSRCRTAPRGPRSRRMARPSACHPRCRICP